MVRACIMLLIIMINDNGEINNLNYIFYVNANYRSILTKSCFYLCEL